MARAGRFSARPSPRPQRGLLIASATAAVEASGVGYEELADRLAKHGMEETESGIASKLARGTFSAIFLLATLALLELEGYDWRTSNTGGPSDAAPDPKLPFASIRSNGSPCPEGDLRGPGGGPRSLGVKLTPARSSYWEGPALRSGHATRRPLSQQIPSWTSVRPGAAFQRGRGFLA
jgi:hypothetical protein